MTALELFLIAALIAVSGFMSGAEIALFSLSRFQLRSLKERSAGAYKLIRRLLGDPAGLLITVLVLNEGVNIALSTLITREIEAAGGDAHLRWLSWLPPWAATSLAGTLVTAPLVLILCEITPKVIAARANQLVAPLTVKPLTWVYVLLYPARAVLVRLVRVVSRALGKDARQLEHGGATPPLKEEEFLVMIEEGHREGAIQQSEMELIRNVFDLDDTQVREISTPITRVQTVPHDMPLKAAYGAIRSLPYSRIPVTRSGSRRQVVGILYRKDLLLARLEPEDSQATIESLMHKPLFVSESLRLNALFRRLKQHRTHIAIVESAQGEAIGVVTMTDVLDALFEDILDPEATGSLELKR